ncbi:serine O-acetyltransferase [Alcaligenes sp. HNGD-HTN06]|uniref:serine O-acetyltransferase n=1 Tax=Alcaligenes sp. HNGD-HTN06 TaxID=3416924 RepID=UPI003CF20DE2
MSKCKNMPMLAISDEEIILSKVVGVLSRYSIYYLKRSEILDLCSMLIMDMNAFLEKNPSANNDYRFLLLSYSSFDAVIGYRISNYILFNYGKVIEAKKISEYFKVRTGIEIHPAASIGHSFVIDHGVGTVIGETCVIGDNCYFLQQVILGSSHIAFNEKKSRHPIVGNNVEIGGFARIFGKVRIGNNVKISPHSIIRSDIPDNCSVVMESNEQKIILRN